MCHLINSNRHALRVKCHNISTHKDRIAEQEGFTNAYTVTTSKNARLDFHDVFKRVSDGQVFRVTSNADDMQTPQVASFSFWQVSAEEWRLS